MSWIVSSSVLPWVVFLSTYLVKASIIGKATGGRGASPYQRRSNGVEEMTVPVCHRRAAGSTMEAFWDYCALLGSL